MGNRLDSAINVMPLLALHFGNARQVAQFSALHLQDYHRLNRSLVERVIRLSNYFIIIIFL